MLAFRKYVPYLTGTGSLLSNGKSHMVADLWSQVRIPLGHPVSRLVFTTLYEVLTYLEGFPHSWLARGGRWLLDRFGVALLPPVSMIQHYSTYIRVTGSVSIQKIRSVPYGYGEPFV